MGGRARRFAHRRGVAGLARAITGVRAAGAPHTFPLLRRELENGREVRTEVAGIVERARERLRVLRGDRGELVGAAFEVLLRLQHRRGTDDRRRHDHLGPHASGLLQQNVGPQVERPSGALAAVPILPLRGPPQAPDPEGPREPQGPGA